MPLWQIPAAGAAQPWYCPYEQAGPACSSLGRLDSGSGHHEDPDGPAGKAPTEPWTKRPGFLAVGPSPETSLGQQTGPQTPTLLEAEGPHQAQTKDPAGPVRRLQGW